MTCFIDNGIALSTMSRYLIRKYLGGNPEDVFDVIITEAYKKPSEVVAAIEMCSSIYINTCYTTIGAEKGHSSNMLDDLIRLALKGKWKSKRVINLKPEAMMEYTDEQRQMLRHLEEESIASFEYLCEIVERDEGKDTIRTITRLS